MAFLNYGHGRSPKKDIMLVSNTPSPKSCSVKVTLCITTRKHTQSFECLTPFYSCIISRSKLCWNGTNILTENVFESLTAVLLNV